MSKTTNLGLNIHDNPGTNEDEFDIDTYINSNWNLLDKAVGNKVDKVTGKDLSTNDYTTAEKTKLSGISNNANNYSLPIASSSVLGGIKIGTNLSINSGVVSAKDTTYAAATTTTAGLESAADKTKLDGIAAGANNYSLPTATSTVLGGVKIGTGLNISNGVLNTTDEIITGQEVATNEYVDGNRVYVKKIDIGTGPALGTTKSYDLSNFGILSTYKLVRYICIDKTANMQLPNVIGDEYSIYCWINSPIIAFKIRCGTSSNISSDTITLTMYYTKS